MLTCRRKFGLVRQAEGRVIKNTTGYQGLKMIMKIFYESKSEESPLALRKNLEHNLKSIPEQEFSNYINFLQDIIKDTQIFKDVLAASNYRDYQKNLIDNLTDDQLTHLNQIVNSLKRNLFNFYKRGDKLLEKIYTEKNPQRPSQEKASALIASIHELGEENLDQIGLNLTSSSNIGSKLGMIIISLLMKDSKEKINKMITDNYSDANVDVMLNFCIQLKKQQE